MLKNQIIFKLKETLGFAPTPSQAKLLENLAQFTIEGRGGDVLIVKGYAGTGKTTALSAYVKVLRSIGFKVVLLAPTGRAAKVFTSYSDQPAYTIHKKIYRQKASKDGFGSFVIDRNLHSHTIFIVDEASMISNQSFETSVFGTGYVLKDLFTYLNNDRNCRLILVGDAAQLPPVGLDVSPALEKNEIEVFSQKVVKNELLDVVRQTSDSGILFNATNLRHRIDEGQYDLPLLFPNDFPDIIPLHGSELIDALIDSYDKVGVNDTLVICRSNKRANKYNQGIRNQVLWREEEIFAGDLLMVVKNNYYWGNDFEEIDFIANGDVVEVRKVHGYKELYGFRFAKSTVCLVDYDLELEVMLLLDSLHSETAALTNSQNRELYYNILEDYVHLKTKQQQYQSVKNNEYFNALQVKYAYAVTCHKSQGGQWKEVYVDAGYLTKDMVDKEYLRWLYTAITRGTEKVYLVNFPPEFIGQLP